MNTIKTDDICLYPVEFPGGKKRYYRHSDLLKLKENVQKAIDAMVMTEMMEISYLDELHRLGMTRMAARQIAVFKKGIHAKFFDRWAKTKSWRKPRG